MRKTLSILVSVTLFIAALPIVNYGLTGIFGNKITQEYPLLDLSDIEASAKTSHENWGWYVSNLFDGDLDTGYSTVGRYDASTHPEIDEWVHMDLGQVHTINKLGFAAHATGSYNYLPYAFTIEVSETGEAGDWATAFDTDSVGPLTGENYPSNDPKRSAYFFDFPEITGRFVKFNMSAMSSSSTVYEVRLMQIMLYGESTQIIEEPDTGYPLLDLSSVSATSKTSIEQWGWSLNNLFNGDIDAGYSTSGGYDETTHPEIDEWIQMDLGSMHEIDRFGFVAYRSSSYNYLPYAFTMEVSETGEEGSWTTVFETDSVGPLTGANYPEDDPKRSAYFFDFPLVECRHIRLNFSALSESATNYELRMMEVLLYGEATEIVDDPDIEYPLLNLSHVQATARTSIEQWGWSLNNLFNGNIDAGYSTSGGYDETTHPEIDEWIQMDLGLMHEIDRFGFVAYRPSSYNYLPYAFTMEVSETGEEGSWTTVFETDSVGPLTGANYPEDDPKRSAYFFDFPLVECRYIRLNFSALSESATNYELRMMEILLYGEATEILLSHRNLALDMLGEENITARSQMSAYPVKNLIDADRDTHYISSGGYSSHEIDEWVEVDLTKEHELSSFSFTTFGFGSGMYMPYKFTVSLSDTGEVGTWETVYSENSLTIIPSQTYRFDFPNAKGRYVRFHVTELQSSSTSYELRLRYIRMTGAATDGIDLDGPGYSETTVDYEVPSSHEKIDLTYLFTEEQLYGTDTGRMVGWDIENKIIQASKSFEMSWSTGWGKGYLIDGNVPGPMANGRPQNYYTAISGFVGHYTGVNTDNIPNGGYDFIRLDLQSIHEIDKFVFYSALEGSRQGFPEDFTLSVSTDSISGPYTEILDVRKLQTSPGQRAYAFGFDEVEARYVQIKVTYVSDLAPYSDMGYALSLSEIEFYGTTTGTDPEPPEEETWDEEADISDATYEQIDLVSLPENSISSSSQYQNYSAAMLIDGDMSSRWLSNSGAKTQYDLNEWILVDLGETRKVNRFAFHGYASGSSQALPVRFAVRVSENNEDWTTAYINKTITLAGGSRYYEFSFPEVEGRYVEVEFFHIGRAYEEEIRMYEVSLRQIELYSSSRYSAEISVHSRNAVAGTVGNFDVILENDTEFAAKDVEIKVIPPSFGVLLDDPVQKVDVPAYGQKVLNYSLMILEGGRAAVQVETYWPGDFEYYVEKAISASGPGYYSGDSHSHSLNNSDGNNTVAENAEYGFKNSHLSFAFTTDHNSTTQIPEADSVTEFYDNEFINMVGVEFTSYDAGHALALNYREPFPEGFAANFPKGDTERWQSVIDYYMSYPNVSFYLAHPYGNTRDEFTDQTLEDLRNFTGVEVWNSKTYQENTVTVNDPSFVAWDSMNTADTGRYNGLAVSDAHYARHMGIAKIKGYMDSLSEENIIELMASGAFYGTNGPELRFNINGVGISDTLKITTESETAIFNINVYDPNSNLKTVEIIKNTITGIYESNREVVYSINLSNDSTNKFENSIPLTVSENEFYRIEVTSEKRLSNPDFVDTGLAYTNNIWIESSTESNSTNIDSISYDSVAGEIKSTPIGIKYIDAGGDEFDLSKLIVQSEAQVEKTYDLQSEAVTVSLTAQDGSERNLKLFVINSEQKALESKVELTKENGDFIVKIDDWKPDYQYQIWTWQEVASDAFGNMDQWVLSQPYTLGSEMDPGPEGSISANLGDVFNSPDKFYTVAVKIIDGDGNFVGQLKDTYTPAEVGEVIIEKVEVDGVFADGTIVRDIDDETVGIQVFTNITDGVTYEATVNPGSTALTPDGNSFDWDISELTPGRYTVNLKAQNGEGTSDERTVRFNLYKVDETIVYGQMDTITVTGEVNEGVFAIDISPDIPSGNWVNYTISEPWRSAIYRSDAVSKEAAETGMVNSGISEGEYGIYQVATYVRRSIGGSADDGMIRRVEYARDGAKSLDIEVDGDGYTSGTLTKDEGVQITITPDAELDLSQGEQMEYSYWRRDARGWVMIRDYSPTPGLTWTPARVGLYTIQVRAKGSDAGSYELIQNIEFNVTGTDPLLTVDEITLSGTDNVDARVPATITAGVVNPSSEDLLYKYIISNDYIYYVETSYSADPTYIWTPGKAGEYRVSVLVKNQASFGKYDDVQTFTLEVK